MSTSGYTNPGQTSPASASVDAEAVARAKREIQGLVQEIAELSRSDAEPDQFYDALLNKVVAALAAPGGAVWMIGDAGALQLVYQINLRETGLADSPLGQAQHGRLLQQVLQSTEGALFAPHSGHAGTTDDDENAAANPTDFLLVMGPVHNDQGPQGIVEVFQRSDARPATQRGYLRFLMQSCELAGDFLRSRRLRHLHEKQSLWEQLESFTRLVHEKLDSRQVAYSVANEGRRLIGCDRVSVAIQRGRRCPVEAVSGQDTFDKRSNTMVLLGKLARAVTKTGEDVWYTGDTSDFAPQVERAVDAYVDESHTKAMAILPLFEPRDEEDLREDQTPPKVIGALIVEQMVDSRPPEGFKQRVDVVRSHSATAINNALSHEGVFLMPVWKALGRATSLFRGRTLPKTLAVLALLVSAVAAACLVPADFALEADGRLQPELRRHVFAYLDGTVERVLVDHDAQVSEGQVLVEQQSLQLDEQQVTLAGRLHQTLAQIQSTEIQLSNARDLSDVEEHQAAAQLNQLEKEAETLRIQLELVGKKRELLKVRSPIDGKVISWQNEERLMGRPVNRGDRLMEVADPSGDWELEVQMTESRMGHIAAAAEESDEPLKVTFILATHPDEYFEGEIVEIGASADVRDDKGNSVPIRVTFDQARLREVVASPKVGAEATAKVHCGQRAIGYVWLHDLFDFVRSKILFKLF